VETTQNARNRKWQPQDLETLYIVGWNWPDRHTGKIYPRAKETAETAWQGALFWVSGCWELAVGC
jgi:hypothetical protein